jgi:hypothetical protein
VRRVAGCGVFGEWGGEEGNVFSFIMELMTVLGGMSRDDGSSEEGGIDDNEM